MITVTDYEKTPYDVNSVVTVGTFDGVHLGHQHLINLLVSQSRNRTMRSVVVTFDPHPQTIVGAGTASSIRILTTFSEKLDLLRNLGLDLLVVMRFDQRLASMTGEQFVLDILVPQIGLSKCLLGHDHSFGKDRSGNLHMLQELGRTNGFDVESIQAVGHDGNVVKSTRIRQLLMNGDVQKASKLLGRFYSLSGLVLQGEQRGRMLGFPTANLSLSDRLKLVPLEGVYATRVTVNNQTFKGVTNIGRRPTFGSGGEPSIETHLVGFEDALYGETITVEFLSRLRDEQKFASTDDLSARIRQDISDASAMNP